MSLLCFSTVGTSTKYESYRTIILVIFWILLRWSSRMKDLCRAKRWNKVMSVFAARCRVSIVAQLEHAGLQINIEWSSLNLGHVFIPKFISLAQIVPGPVEPYGAESCPKTPVISFPFFPGVFAPADVYSGKTFVEKNLQNDISSLESRWLRCGQNICHKR